MKVVVILWSMVFLYATISFAGEKKRHVCTYSYEQSKEEINRDALIRAGYVPPLDVQALQECNTSTYTEIRGFSVPRYNKKK